LTDNFWTLKSCSVFSDFINSNRNDKSNVSNYHTVVETCVDFITQVQYNTSAV